MDTDEIINFQVALAKKIIHKMGTENLPLEFHLSIYDQCNRDRRTLEINKNKNNNHRLATAKQKQLMDNLGVEYKEDMDIKTASRLIQDALKEP
jgi:hypothetical protein